ncbi:hypothetical protein SAMN05444672_11628 [Bacillus sp. OK838]|nr:hypothetical protein SAMN05444672_11628 [Bacillus sp. OK838]
MYEKELCHLKNIVDPWFTVQELDSETFAISEYGHWEKVHPFYYLGRPGLR